jgi:gliding motility-associated-like protein
VDSYELLGLMNQFDPVPGWSLQGDSVFVGGDLTQTYGFLRIISAQDQTIEAAPGQKDVFFGTQMPFSTGQHTLIFRRVQTGCLDTMRVRVICTDCPPIHNYTPNAQDEIVWNVANCAGDTAFCTNILNQELGDYTISDNGQIFTTFSFCGDNVGLRLDTGFHDIHIYNNVSFCEYHAKVRITCSGSPADSLTTAVPDNVATLKNTEIEIPLLANDIILGIVGNTAGLKEFIFLSNPPNGTVTYDDLLGVVVYTPNDGFCGADTFSYEITDLRGQRSSAAVSVTIVCDKVLIYTGISPNGDGKNDFWHIVGIEQFPSNVVRVFNRWGNLVFEQKGYSNLEAWNGTWNGKDLPDGAYFYTIDLGDESGVLSGYLQLMR